MTRCTKIKEPIKAYTLFERDETGSNRMQGQNVWLSALSRETVTEKGLNGEKWVK